MPHTSRKKRPASQTQKRLEVTDSNGWTHVTTGGNARRVLRKAGPVAAKDDHEFIPSILLPAEAPRQLTIDELKGQLDSYRRRWESSATWHALEDALRRRRSIAQQADTAGSPPGRRAIVCLGLGSPSGFLKGGWVDRRSVSLYQLAALASIMDIFFDHPSHPDDTNVLASQKVFAQDPVFNDLDKELLQSLGITVVEHPAAFDLVDEHSFLYCPGAEKSHLEQLLQPSHPALLFGGPLEDTDSEILNRFLDTRDSARLPPFEPNEHAFWNMRLYWKKN